MALRNLINAERQVRAGSVTNELLADSAVTLAKLAQGAELLKRDGSVAYTADQDAGGFKLTNLADGISPQDAATVSQLNSLIEGLDPKGSVVAATTADITLSGEQTIDGVAVVTGDRVLVKDQTDATLNGIYVADSAAWSRADDHNDSNSITGGNFVFVEDGGTNNAGTGWIVIGTTFEVGTDPIVWSQFSKTSEIQAGNGLTKSGTVLDVNVGNGLQITADAITIGLADSTLVVDAEGLKAGTLTDANFADGTLSVTKLVGGNTLLKSDGTVAWAADQNGGGFKLTSIADGVADTDAATVGQVKQKLDASKVLVEADSPFAAPSDESLATNAAVAAYVMSQIPLWVHNGSFTGTKDGVNTTFTLSDVPAPVESLKIFMNGLRLANGFDFTVTDSTVTMTDAPAAEDTFDVEFRTQ